MATEPTDDPTRGRSLRLWPGVLAAALLLLTRFGIPIVAPEAAIYAVLCGLVGALAIVVWWLFFSRAAWVERLGAVGLMVVALFAVRPLLHESIATAGMGALFFVYAVPALALALVAWAAVGRNLSGRRRWATMAATILLAGAGWALVRINGITAGADSDFAWRWAPTPEERLLTRAEKPIGLPVTGATDAKAEWSGFRGPDRNSVVPGVRLATDWSASPPQELWRRPVGPGWSSFAVHGDLLYTQEQRGEDEVVACYDATSGEPVWRHSNPVRFWEANAGAGPRGTPTVSDGRVYALGATGILNVLDARDGSVVWTRDAASDTGAKEPMWGFSSSPLVTGDLVVVAPSNGLVAYDLASGEPRWLGPDPVAGESYSSPHLATIDGLVQVLALSATGLVSVDPADGTLLWEHPWSGVPIVQPALTMGGEVLISTSASSGLRRLAVANGGGARWTVEERWTSRGLKPYFNDFVLHEGHAYGFDGGILASIDLEDGKRRWKGGRYGHGQLVLLPDQDLLLVLSERGELALVSATPEGFRELSRFPAIEGKTWNHPVLVDDLLLVRNDREMAAFRLALAS